MQGGCSAVHEQGGHRDRYRPVLPQRRGGSSARRLGQERQYFWAAILYAFTAIALVTFGLSDRDLRLLRVPVPGRWTECRDRPYRRRRSRCTKYRLPRRPVPAED